MMDTPEIDKLDFEMWLRFITGSQLPRDNPDNVPGESIVFQLEEKNIVVTKETDQTFTIEEQYPDGRVFVDFTNKPVHKLMKLDKNKIINVSIKTTTSDH